MSRRAGSRKRGARGTKARAIGGRKAVEAAEMSRDSKRVRFQSPPSGGSPEPGESNTNVEAVERGDFGLSISSAGNRFTVLQDQFTLPETVLGEDSDCETEETGADRSRLSANVSRARGGDDAFPSPGADLFSFPEGPLGEASDSGSNATDREEDAAHCAYRGTTRLLNSLPSVPVGEQGSDDLPLEGLLAVLPQDSLPWRPVGEESDLSGEGGIDALSDALSDSGAEFRESNKDVIPEVVVQLAPSPVRMGGRPVVEPILNGLFDSAQPLEFVNDSASPPPSSGAPSSWNTPSSAADASLPPLSPFFGGNHSSALTADDRAARLDIEEELAQACAEKDVIAAEVSKIAAAEAVAQRMQEMPLASLPKYWSAYQYGLSLRVQQARAVWDRMAVGGRNHGLKG